MPRPQSFFRRLAIPLAALPVTLATVFAFSLGPSPHKAVANYLASDAPKAQRLAQLNAAGDGVAVVLAERINDVDLAHRAEAIAYIRNSDSPRAQLALQKLSNTDASQASLGHQQLN